MLLDRRNSLPRHSSCLRGLFPLLSGIVIATCIGCNPPARVVSTDADSLTVLENAETSSDPPTQASYKVEADTEIVRDGETARLEQLGKGDAVQVIATQRDGERVAIEIVAQSNAESEQLHPLPDSDPQKTLGTEPQEKLESLAPLQDQSYRGLIGKVEKHEIEVIDKAGEKKIIVLGDDTEITVDGEAASVDQLATDQLVTIRFEDGNTVFIHATSEKQPRE